MKGEDLAAARKAFTETGLSDVINWIGWENAIAIFHNIIRAVFEKEESIIRSKVARRTRLLPTEEFQLRGEEVSYSPVTLFLLVRERTTYKRMQDIHRR